MRVGTRGSALARAQAEGVAAALGDAEVVAVRTADGEAGDKSRFVRGVQRALLAGEVEVGVHSAKDLPAELADGLVIAGVPRREDPADALVGGGASLDDLPEGARVGTASVRRRSQLLALRPDLEVIEVHGNVDTRLEKLARDDLDAIVLAVAGLRRLGRADQIAFAFDPGELTPAPGQGALALEVRSDDGRAAAAASAITDRGALAELTAERAAAAALAGSCSTPIGICARRAGQGLVVRGYAGLPDGSDWVRDRIEGDADDAAALGRELAERMVAAGAGELLQRAEAQAS